MDLKAEVQKILAQVKSAVEDLAQKLGDEKSNEPEVVTTATGEIVEELECRKIEFDRLVSELEADSEFEKFTIAFFGQTNAGKSTIIEALRILLDEEGRKYEVRDNLIEKERRREEYLKACSEVIRDLEALRASSRPVPIWRHLIVPTSLFLAGGIVGFLLAKGLL